MTYMWISDAYIDQLAATIMFIVIWPKTYNSVVPENCDLQNILFIVMMPILSTMDILSFKVLFI